MELTTGFAAITVLPAGTGFCADDNGSKCKELGREFHKGDYGVARFACRQLCEAWRGCQAVELLRLHKAYTLCKVCGSAATRTNKAPANNVECLTYKD
ncbi:hypothetical protein EMIHUDRAFT_245002 [Emiliania huxleyi CCMP1516]|uniref:Apple domain-containing protein n=2 Tax=Emiliania huxleyi TaxID=2903 RepID=A0A0D3IZ51_EMIH1|nr:hypothetical protein EMIHUDRAFT_245002 [Emiliania huxleyi CCMP1516]EOD16536.1 hypothetical protein EMIHUDRAFT_245002 [Emiliania huxleyi CCMP1516]|eukprot:XP_005768965.1 hypothetical protein EMIHUDRAFT_245002 [Emiliania huxleyi CCMP1516]